MTNYDQAWTEHMLESIQLNDVAGLKKDLNYNANPDAGDALIEVARKAEKTQDPEILETSRQMAQALLDKGANINLINSQNKSPIEAAAYFGNGPVAELLAGQNPERLSDALSDAGNTFVKTPEVAAHVTQLIESVLRGQLEAQKVSGASEATESHQQYVCSTRAKQGSKIQL